MSADNYYTVKWNRDDNKFYVVHGFMSTLEDGIPATIHDGQPGYDDWDTAERAAHEEWSEYGVIHEGAELDLLVTYDQFEAWARKKIDTLRHYLGEND